MNITPKTLCMINNVYQSINHIFIEGDNNKEMWAEAKELEANYEIIEIIYKWGVEKPRKICFSLPTPPIFRPRIEPG